jgi:hypothetical protein
VLAVSFATVLVGCSQDDDDPGVASLSSDPTSGTSGEPSQEDTEKAMKKYDDCLRSGLQEYGIDPIYLFPPDLGPGETDPEPSDADQKAIDEVMQDCEKYRLTQNLSEEEKTGLMERALKVSQCMRDKGYDDFPDPRLGQDGGVAMEFNQDSGLDPKDPAFLKAEKECHDEHNPDPDDSEGQS